MRCGGMSAWIGVPYKVDVTAWVNPETGMVEGATVYDTSVTLVPWHKDEQTLFNADGNPMSEEKALWASEQAEKGDWPAWNYE